MNNYPDTFAFVQIHVGDSYSTSWGNSRFSFYAGTGYPMTIFDGVLKHSGSHTYTIYQSEFLSRASVPTDVTIELTGDFVSGQAYEVQANVCVEAGGAERTMRIYMVQVLDYWPASPTYHRNGFKQAADTHGSEPDITLAGGECETIVREFTFDADSWADQENIKIVVWAQVPGSPWPKEAYQSAVMAWPFPPSTALFIELPDGVPEYIPSGEPTDITVQIDDGSETYVPGSGTLYYRYDGGTFLTDSLTSLGGNLYAATLPAPACDDTPEFYISADGDGGTTVYSPEDAPASYYTTGVGTVTVILDDDFETDQGWTVEDVGPDPPINGSWERDVPVDEPNEDYHPPRSDYDGSGQCYLTENLLGNSDVDLGPTRLISPTFDLSEATDPILRFAYWWWNDDQDGDPMEVEISNDDGATWIPVQTIANVPPEWFQQEIHIASAIDPEPLTALMKVRFSVMDDPNNSKDEGGIDAVEVFEVDCQTFGDIDGDGDVDLDDYAEFEDCMTGPCAVPPCDPPLYAELDCHLADFEDDGDVDLEDFATFERSLVP